MMAAAVVILEAAACLGYGSILIRLLGLSSVLDSAERLAWSFACGFGVLGWILFFIGWAGAFQGLVFVAVLVVGAGGLVLLCDVRLGHVPRPRGIWDWLLVSAFFLIAVGDILEALAPPADGDTLAYHFALPKQFISSGVLEFVPRAVDGATPMIVHMTYVPVLALGGEMALTFWCMITGWASAILLFVFTRRYASRRIAACAALIYTSIPVVLAGGGTGQVETRMTMFVIVSIAALIDMQRSGDRRFAVLAGVTTGFYIAAKYIGLLFAAAMGLAMLVDRPRVKSLILFSVAAMVAGFQWYLWNWMHTGDPLYPMLVGALGIGDVNLWPPDFNAWFNQMTFAGERAVPRNPFWFVAYPIVETFVSFPQFGGARVGLGPFTAIGLPLAAIAIWGRRRMLVNHPLFPAAIAVVAFYTLWFIVGPSQRVRHLLPVYSVVITMIAVALGRLDTDRRGVVAVGSVVGMTALIQIGGQLLYSANYLHRLTAHEDRDAFLLRNVSEYAAVPWINANLRADDRILIMSRQLSYLIDVPYFLGHLYQDPRIDLRIENFNSAKLLKSLHQYGITHILSSVAEVANDGTVRYVPNAPLDALDRLGCLYVMKIFKVREIESRTLAASAADAQMGIFRLRARCS